MALDDIYVKTNKGTEEVSRRTYHLNHRLRTLLIMIDGVRPAFELVEAAQRIGLEPNFLADLARDGFITLKKPGAMGAGSTAASVEEVVETLPPPTSEDADHFLRAQQAMNDIIVDKLGSIRGYGMMLKLQRAGTVAELRTLLTEFHGALVKRLTPQEAQALTDRVRSLLG
jgi:hypothetical protein